jgi:hypothetical protein
MRVRAAIDRWADLVVALALASLAQLEVWGHAPCHLP